MKKRLTALSLLIICFLGLTACEKERPLELRFLDAFGVKIPDNMTAIGIIRLYTVNTQKSCAMPYIYERIHLKYKMASFEIR